MKKEIHPNQYRFVIFHDTSCDKKFLMKSTAPSKEEIKWKDGKNYPVVKIGISSASSPIYTGKKRSGKKQGRSARFNKKYGL